MKNKLFITLALFCAVAVGIAYAAGTITLPRTGQTTSYAAGDDGDLKKGITWPSPRFTDNGNGTVTDNLTGLIWLQNANCSAIIAGITNTGTGLPWGYAITWSNGLASGACGLTDGSVSGQWRLPNVTELESLIDLNSNNPALPAGYLSYFNGVQASDVYWSSSIYAGSTAYAWYVTMNDGGVNNDGAPKSYYVWPVRAGL
ncbi:MAG: DUF1566 domain-containing protein [Desulfuromonadales bacterium]